MDELFSQLAAAPESTKLVLMPFSRALVEFPCQVGRFRIYPPNEIEFENFRPVPNRQPEVGVSGHGAFKGQDLREVLTSLTGFDVDVLRHNPVVAFPAEIDWDEFLRADHAYDISLIRRLSSIAERAFDYVRFNLCRFDLPDTLPGVVGSWKDSGSFLGALIYTLPDNESYLIAGEAIDCTVVAKGIGLDFDFQMSEDLPSSADGEVAAIAIHGLTLSSDVMMANNDTIKFLRAMTLLEFLATPDEFRSWKKLKGDIACHYSATKSEYLEHCERFRELTHILDGAGEEAGIRTLLIHHGRFLHDIVPAHSDRRSLFRELDRYCGCVLQDMLDNSTMTWLEFQELRAQKKTALGVA